MATRKKKKVGDEAKPFLSDDMIINILSRLPIKDVMHCRLVCKSWRDLTLDHDFVDSHCTNRTPPTILVADSAHHTTGLGLLFSLDKWWEPARKRSMFHKFPSGFMSNTPCALFSHAGLTVFKEYKYINYPFKFSILNPTTSSEIVHVTVSKDILGCQIYGVFFHPTLKEYCSLWNIPLSTDGPRQNHFKMLILGSNPHFKTVSNHPFDHNYMFLGRRHNPVFIDKYLYWMFRLKNAPPKHIVEFSILREEIRVISCPFVMHGEENSRLLNIDGTLSCLIMNPTNVTIWRMKHPTDQLWTSSVYNLDLERYSRYGQPIPIAVVEGKLLISFERRLLVCDLMEGTVKNYQQKRYRQTVEFLPHQMSLATLKNCKPRIFIDQHGQLVVR